MTDREGQIRTLGRTVRQLRWRGNEATIEVELPGTGEPILDGAAELLFLREYDAEMARCGDLAAYTTDEMRAELARRADSARGLSAQRRAEFT